MPFDTFYIQRTEKKDHHSGALFLDVQFIPLKAIYPGDSATEALRLAQRDFPQFPHSLAVADRPSRKTSW